MPHWDFKCGKCGRVADLYFQTHAIMKRSVPLTCGSPFESDNCNGLMELQPSAPGVVNIEGFNAGNGYASPRTFTSQVGHIKTTVTGNPEILN